jgi:thiaminase/transcriptional activator TenA
MSVRPSEQLRRKVEAVWESLHQHPFVRGLADGSLDAERFQTWLRQDYLFLIDFTRLVCVAAARGPDVETMKWMATLAHSVLHNEMLLHQAYAVEFGLTREELETGGKLPTTRAYTNQLLRLAGTSTFVEVVGALLPRVWGHAEIGQRLSRKPGQPATGFSRWIELYSGPMAAGLARQARELFDRLAAAGTPRALTLAEEAFAVSSRYEWMFWQMCWQGESWPV